MNTQDIKSLAHKHIINTYGERRLAIVRGDGAKLWDAEGNEYLDFFAGIAVTNLGHCHPTVTKAIQEQAATLLHVSNLYYIEPQAKLAAMLCANSFADKWFFANDGAGANEAAIKLARRYWVQKGTPKPELISAKQSFHGRTLATITATGQPKYQEGFDPLMPGMHHVPYNDLDALAVALKKSVGAVLLEPIQGEGGVRVPDDNYLAEVRSLCDERGALLILDEVQTGIGRTGKLFAYEHAGITPDVICLAKALGNGVPIAAMGCTDEVAGGFEPGTHATTFGGNPLCTAAAVATLSVMLEDGFLGAVAARGDHFLAGLSALADKHDCIQEVRGKGLMLGVELDQPVVDICGKMADAGIICGPAGPNVLRFLPPLIVTNDEIDRVVAALDNVLGAM